MEFDLIRKKLENNLSPEEQLEFDAWYEESEDHREYFSKVANKTSVDISSIDEKSAWQNIENRIKRKKSFKKEWILAIAACFVLAIGSSLFYNTSPVEPKVTFQPTSEKIILVTENGESVELSKDKTYAGENYKGSGSQLIYNKQSHTTEKAALNILKVPRGEEFYVELADNTKIWLNSDSKIKYPTSFEKNEPRIVELLYGEVYFEVSSSKESNGANFFVKTGEQTIEVLGTEFNVRAYPEDTVIATSLAEGKISLSNDRNHRKSILKPGMQSVYNPEEANWKVEKINVANAISWKDGVYRFEDEELKTIMMGLSRWFDKEVIFADEDVQFVKFNGVFRKTQDLQNVLKMLQETNVMHYELQDNKIIIKKDEKQKNRN